MLKLKIISIVLCIIFIIPCKLSATIKNPEQFVTEFYNKYINDIFFLDKDDVYNYVDKETLKYIKKHSEFDYFTRQGMDINYDISNIIVDKVIIFEEKYFLVPVTINLVHKGKSYQKISIVIILKNIDGRYLITRVVDTYPYL